MFCIREHVGIYASLFKKACSPPAIAGANFLGMKVILNIKD